MRSGLLPLCTLANREAANEGSRLHQPRQPLGSLVPSGGPHGVHPIGDAGGVGLHWSKSRGESTRAAGRCSFRDVLRSLVKISGCETREGGRTSFDGPRCCDLSYRQSLPLVHEDSLGVIRKEKWLCT